MTSHVSIRIVLLTVFICKAEIAELHHDFFFSGCNEVRYVNNAIFYQVEFHQTYVEDCVLKFYGYPAERYRVCAKIVDFKLPCENNRRLTLVFMRDKVSDRTEFDCRTKKLMKDYCGEFVYMFLRTNPYSKKPYTQNGSVLLINVTAVQKMIVDRTNNSEQNNGKENSKISLEKTDEEKDDTRIAIIIASASSAGVVVIASILCLLVFFLNKRRSSNSTLRSDQNGHPGRSVTSNTTRPNIAYRWVASPNEYVQLPSDSDRQTEVIPRSHISNRDSAETVSLQSIINDELSVPSNDAVSSHQETPGISSSQCNNLSSDYQNVETAAEQSPAIEHTNDINTTNLAIGPPGVSRRSPDYYNTDQEEDKSEQSAAYQTLWN